MSTRLTLRVQNPEICNQSTEFRLRSVANWNYPNPLVEDWIEILAFTRLIRPTHTLITNPDLHDMTHLSKVLILLPKVGDFSNLLNLVIHRCTHHPFTLMNGKKKKKTCIAQFLNGPFGIRGRGGK